MARYIAARCGAAVVVALLITVLLSMLERLVPGDPARTVLGPRATPELVEAVRAQLGLDKPVHVQVWDFVTGAVRGDLGNNFLSQTPVSELVGNALPHTLILAVCSLGVAALVGIPLGAYAAAHRGSWIDRITALVSVSVITVPSYVAGLLLLLLFAVKLRWLPAIGAGTESAGSYVAHLVLPTLALALLWIGYLARLVRSSMLEVLESNYIRTAHAFGLRSRVVLYKHALRNAITPTVAVLGVGLGNLLGGAVFVEVIFNRPGLGTLIFYAIGTRDYATVRGGVLVAALLFVLANLLADIANRVLDPRSRTAGGDT
ncbi:MAG: ABC transporter permease subunit [Streptosporangiales bacterium]|nr:ABC transporter permease subunit [Streptosporangiales bacterium]